jgi:hypothetical protein
MLEAIDNPNNPNIAKSFNMAPINLPPGPFELYPIAYIALEINTTNPNTALTIGKYIPAISKNAYVEGAHST